MATIDHYELQWDTDPGEPYANTETIPPGEPLEFTTPAQVEGTTVYGRVRAVSTDGFAGPWTSEVSALVEVPPPPPDSYTIQSGDVWLWDTTANSVTIMSLDTSRGYSLMDMEIYTLAPSPATIQLFQTLYGSSQVTATPGTVTTFTP